MGKKISKELKKKAMELLFFKGILTKEEYDGCIKVIMKKSRTVKNKRIEKDVDK